MAAQRTTLDSGTSAGYEAASDCDRLNDLLDESIPLDERLLAAPELDDLTDTDNLVALSLEPREDLGLDLDDEWRALEENANAVTDVLPRIGQHRKPRTTAVKSRVLVAAMAVGGAAAATYSVVAASDDFGHTSTKTVLASNATGAFPAASAASTNNARGVQLVTVTPAANSTIHSEEFAKGAAFAQERAEREARLQRPLFVKPTNGIFTSGFGYRWGALHAGVDLAAPIGTPIYAVADGVVTDAGPTAGYGAWVKIRHADGTVSLYGHVNSWLVSPGQRVMAGDQIATVGNRGQSTGPHCHFSVLLNGTDFIDPQPWLAQRGITLGAYTP